MIRTTIGVVLGAAIYFGWSAVSWTVLPFHRSIMKALPNEQLVTDTLKTVAKEPGFYSFPSRAGRSEEDWARLERKGPVGVLVFSPAGREPMSRRNFWVEAAGAVSISLVLMAALSFARDRLKGFLGRMIFAAALGAMAWLAVDLPYWNWFGFPADHSLACLLDRVVGFLLIGAVQAKLVLPRP